MKKRLLLSVALVALLAMGMFKAQTAVSEAPTYVGPDLCKMCHKSKDTSVTAFDASKHATALKAPGVDGDEKCLPCHTTGYGKETGYKTGGDNNAKTGNVTCEACHGIGSLYKGIMTKTPDMYDAGLITPSVAVCVTCHNKDYKDFKSFSFQEYSAKIRHGKEDYLKSHPAVQAAYIGKAKCVMCHKSRDNSVAVYDASKHAKALEALATDEAKKYSADPLNDVKCLACHTTGLTDAGGFDPAAAQEDRDKLAGVQCESCHGPGEKYKSIMSKKDEAEVAGLVTPTEKTCRKCHNSLSPTFKGFKFDEAVKLIAHKKN